MAVTNGSRHCGGYAFMSKQWHTRYPTLTGGQSGSVVFVILLEVIACGLTQPMTSTRSGRFRGVRRSPQTIASSTSRAVFRTVNSHLSTSCHFSLRSHEDNVCSGCLVAFPGGSPCLITQSTHLDSSSHRCLTAAYRLAPACMVRNILYTLMHRVFSWLDTLTTQQLEWTSYIALFVGKTTLLHASCTGRFKSSLHIRIEPCWSTFAQDRFSSASVASVRAMLLH